jgi:hypothetical protein
MQSAQQAPRVELVVPADLPLQTSLLKMGPKQRYVYISELPWMAVFPLTIHWTGNPRVHPADCPWMPCLLKMDFQG